MSSPEYKENKSAYKGMWEEDKKIYRYLDPIKIKNC